MRALHKKAIKDVTRRKLRALLTILGIAIGVMGLSAINIASSQVKGSLQYSLDTSAQPDIAFATSPTAAELSQLLQQQPNVRLAEAETFVSARWRVPTGHFPLQLTGLSDFTHLQFNTFQVSAGHLPNAPDQIALESSDQMVAQVAVGSQIELEVRGAPHLLTVSGLVRTRGRLAASLNGAGWGYMQQRALEALFQLTGANAFLIRVNHTSEEEATAKQLARVLQGQHVQVLGVAVGHSDGGETSVVNGIFAIMQMLSIIALLLSVFLLLSTITTLVAEQVPIMGTMKAIGARQGQVLRNYLTSVAIYGIVGTSIGLGLGLLCGSLLTTFLSSLLTLDVGSLTIAPSLVLLGVGVGVGVPLVAAALPVYLGTRLSVREALSGYGLDGRAGRGGRPWTRRIGRAFGVLPQTVQLGARSLFRKPTRAMLTLLALTIAGAAFLSVQTTSYSLNAFLNEVDTTYHFDIFASLDTPQSYSQVQQVLASVPGMAASEPLFQDGVQTRWGTALLTGVKPDAQLYHKQLVAGRWLTESDQDAVVLSTHAANNSGLKMGDTLAFHNGLSSVTWRIVGLAKDDNNLAGFGVMLVSLREATAFERLPADLTNLIAIQSAISRQAGIDALANRVDDALSRAGVQATIQTKQQLDQANQQQFLILDVLLYSVAVIIALVGAIGLFNALAMSVLERRREIGILRSMGATGRKIAQVFWTEGLSLGVVAWAIGCLIGLPAAYGFVWLLGRLLAPAPFAFDPVSLVLMLGFTVLVASLATLMPVWGATRVKIAQTLRYE
jgi:putative ABC transport system permease protein